MTIPDNLAVLSHTFCPFLDPLFLNSTENVAKVEEFDFLNNTPVSHWTDPKETQTSPCVQPAEGTGGQAGRRLTGATTPLPVMRPRPFTGTQYSSSLSVNPLVSTPHPPQDSTQGVKGTSSCIFLSWEGTGGVNVFML